MRNGSSNLESMQGRIHVGGQTQFMVTRHRIGSDIGEVLKDILNISYLNVISSLNEGLIPFTRSNLLLRYADLR